MIDSQFFRIMTFNLSRVSGIIGEGLRLPHRCKHVENPALPVVLYGDDLLGITKRLRAAKKAHEKAHERKVSDRALVLAGYVASYPKTVQELIDSPFEHQAYLAWRELVMEDVKIIARENPQVELVGCVEHADESHPHIHAWYVAKSHEGKFRLGGIHPGQEAERMKAPKERIPAYKAAMKKWQDQRWRNVSRVCGLSRLSATPVPRLTNIQWKQKKRREAKEQQELLEQKQLENELEAIHRNLKNARHLRF